MVIAIDLTSLSYHMTGIERYAACVSERMIEQDTKNSYILIFRDAVYPTFKSKINGERVKAIILYGSNKLIFYQIILPFSLYHIKADRFLFFAFTSPILFRRKGIFNTIHDMGPWDAVDAMKKSQKLYWRLTMRFSTSISVGMITVSEFSKGRISEILKYPKNKIQVIPAAVYEGITKDYGIEYEAVKEKYSLPDKYIMTLSTLEPRKNMKILLEAYSAICDKVDYELVLVGRKGWMMDEILEKYNTQNRIHITGFVEDDHVALIYKNAICFVFPSLYEGFGMPPVEALAVGTPVVASDAASIPEVLMGQAVYFKNNSKEELESILLTLNENVNDMPHELTDYQKQNYNFTASAERVIEFIQ
jgi:glycosyltransferase involved in cell wall biosynthesis